MTAPTPPSIESFARLLHAVAAFGLPGASPRLDGGPIHTDVWGMLVGQARGRRVSGHLVDAIDHGAIATTPAQRLEALDVHAQAMHLCVRLEVMLVGAADALAHHGIEHRLLKGVGAAHLDYSNPSLRSFGDVDVLVRSAQFDQAVEVLRARGFERRYPEPRPGFDRRFSKGVALVGPDGLELDLHRTLALGRYGLAIDEGDLWAASDALAIGGRAHRALDPTVRFLHACYHAALGDPEPRLTALRDMAQLLDRPGLEVDRAVELAGRWRGEAVLARALLLLEQRLAIGTGAVGEWARSVRPSHADRRALTTYVDPRAGYAARAWSAVGGFSTWRERIAYLWALGMPRRGYLTGRHRTRVTRVVSGLRARPRRRRGRGAGHHAP